jgi:uncharacterized membrane protein YphA (DoxX/SURF4 family)
MSTASPDSSTGFPSSALHIGLWTVQILLGLTFTSAGAMKLTQPISWVVDTLGWPGAVPAALVRFIGASELLGGLGLVLPAATRIKPALTPLAGAGLITVMVLAALFHLTRGEFGAIPGNVILGSLAAFVAWGRWAKVRIMPR